MLKVHLPPVLPDKGKIMIEAIKGGKIDFADQISAIRVSQWPGEHDPRGCRGQDDLCPGCKPYKFAYIFTKNISSTPLRLSPSVHVALVSQCSPIHKPSWVKAVKTSHAFNSVGLSEPDY